MKTTMNEKETAAWLQNHDRYLILTHIRPDGDTIGCASALCLALQRIGKTAYVLPNDGITATYAEYLDGMYADSLYQPETIVAVDIADTNLFTENEKSYANHVDLCIDHHESNKRYAKSLCLDDTAAACGEIVYRICLILNVIDARLAEALYVAVSTDTGCFVYSNTTPVTHEIAAELMRYGSFAPRVNKKCFRTKTAKRLRLESCLMSHAHFYQDGKIAISAITLDDMRNIQADERDAEDIAAFLGQIEGVRISATIREMSANHCKVSLRTDDSLNASDVCALYGGGGHPAAAGCEIELAPDDCIQSFYESICSVQAHGE